MNLNCFTYRIITFFSILFFTLSAGYSQNMTRIKGKVVDAETKEPLPFVNIFVSRNLGTITDYKGEYSIETKWATNKIEASFIGYKPQTKNIILNKSQVINFLLESSNINLNEIKVVADKQRYRNKDNPAVEIIRKVIENKNRKESLDFYEYDKYEKVEFDLNNITEEFKNKSYLKKFQFVFDYVDTSKVNGKPFLPVFLKETSSKVFYRKFPKTEKEYVIGTNMVGLKDYVDNEGISSIIDNIYQEINIYDNNIPLLTNQFISPISDIAPIIYKFHIWDTTNINGHECIRLVFQPRNKADLAFKGNLYVTNDDRCAVIKIEMDIMDEINLNFVNDLKITQEFDFINEQCWMLTSHKIEVDFNFGKKGIGMFGKKSVTYRNYLFNQEKTSDVYAGIDNVILQDGHDKKDKNFWDTARPSKLSKNEEGVFEMIDSIQNVPAFKNTMDIIMLLLAGYKSFGPIDIGPLNAFYSFNDVEGFRMRLGGRTNKKFSKRIMLEGYGLYGFKDEIFKYSAGSTIALNDKAYDEKPRHTIRAMYQYETNFPGMEMQYVNEDNFLLSFKRGVSDKLLYYRLAEIEHYRDWGNGVSSSVTVKNNQQMPGGTLYFDYDNYSKSKITSSEVVARLRFAPNEKFYQATDYKIPIITKYPVFQLTYNKGFKDVFNSDYGYDKLSVNIFKRFYTAPFGFSNWELEAGQLFGNVPFPLLYVHRANQTYSYQVSSYNLMNFLEFVSDRYVSLNVEQYFNGFFFNKIPLFKRLKFREVISFKGIYGGVSDGNNPSKTDGLMKFPTDNYGKTSTFTLQEKPYVEVSAGIANIFKLFRVDLVRRLTYLDNPNVSELGVRVRFKLDF